MMNNLAPYFCVMMCILFTATGMIIGMALEKAKQEIEEEKDHNKKLKGGNKETENGK